MEKGGTITNPEERAVSEFAEIIYKIYRDKGAKEFGKSFRSRAREIPSFLYEVGLISALSFIYAKTEDADKKTYKNIFNYIRGGTQSLEGIDSTEGGYAAYLYLILQEIKRLAPDRNIDAEDPLSSIIAIKGLKRPLISLLMPYLLEIKRLAEATLPSEG
jgi:CRISPR type III-B/RAMP module-associated protein Cmr5